MIKANVTLGSKDVHILCCGRVSRILTVVETLAQVGMSTLTRAADWDLAVALDLAASTCLTGKSYLSALSPIILYRARLLCVESAPPLHSDGPNRGRCRCRELLPSSGSLMAEGRALYKSAEPEPAERYAAHCGVEH